jgi:protein-disulfide isomerase
MYKRQRTGEHNTRKEHTKQNTGEKGEGRSTTGHPEKGWKAHRPVPSLLTMSSHHHLDHDDIREALRRETKQHEEDEQQQQKQHEHEQHRPAASQQAESTLSSVNLDSSSSALVYLPRSGSGGVSVSGSVHPSVLSSDADSDKLFTVLCNYLSLAQLELARTVIEQLFRASPEKAVRALRAIVFTHIPSAWLFSRAVPSAGHLSWLAYIEYKKLFQRIQSEWEQKEKEKQQQQQQQHQQDKKDKQEETKYITNMQPTLINPCKQTHTPSRRHQSLSFHLSCVSSVFFVVCCSDGFISHDRLSVTVLEVENLRIPTSAAVTSTTYQVKLKLDKQQFQTPTATTAANKITTTFKHTFNCSVLYADSVLSFRASAFSAPGRDGVRSEIVVGESDLPINQLRDKTDYTIWQPFTAPATQTAHAFQNQQYGRIKLRIKWEQSGVTAATTQANRTNRTTPSARSLPFSHRLPCVCVVCVCVCVFELVPLGDFSSKTRWLLETDLLLSNAVVNHRLTPSARMLTPQIIEEMRAFARATWQQQQNRNKQNIKTDTNKKQKTNNTEHKQQDTEEQIQGGEDEMENTFAAGGVLQFDELSGAAQLSDEVFKHLRRLIRSVPTVGHALCAQFSSVSVPSDGLFQHLYAQLVGEMMLRKEFGRACEALIYVAKEIFTNVTENTHTAGDNKLPAQAPATRSVADQASSALLDQIFRLFIYFVHHGYAAV